MPEEPPDHDRLFKELITHLFVEFLELFAPQIAAAMDRESIEFIDKEIFSAFVQTDEYEVDILAKIKISGQERFILVHIENQSKAEGGFAERMFHYFALLRAKFGIRVYPIAVLSYDRPLRDEPNIYSETEFGMEVVRYQFHPIQLNKLRWQDYVNNSNPIATALMAKMNVKPEDYITVRRGFYQLFSMGKLNHKQLRVINEFMSAYLKLSREQAQKLREEVEAIMSSQTKREYTGFMTEFDEIAFEKGIEQGVVQGLREGQLRLTLRLLENKFGAVDETVSEQIAALELPKLEDLGVALLHIATADELKAWLAARTNNAA